jgi:hypothetical protein
MKQVLLILGGLTDPDPCSITPNYLLDPDLLFKESNRFIGRWLPVSSTVMDMPSRTTHATKEDFW